MIHNQNDGKGERGKGERSKECVEVTRPPLFKFQSGRNYYGIMPPYCLRCELGRPCSCELLKELTSNNTCFLNTPPFPLSLWKHCSLRSSPPLIFTFRPPCYTYDTGDPTTLQTYSYISFSLHSGDNIANASPRSIHFNELF